MTFQQKIAVVSVVGVLGFGAVMVSVLGSSEGAVDAVKRLMCTNPLAAQQLEPLPRGITRETVESAESRASDSVNEARRRFTSSRDSNVSSTVSALVSGSGSVTLPDGSIHSVGSGPIRLSDYDWGFANED